MRKGIFIFSIIGASFLFFGLSERLSLAEMPVEDVLERLGAEGPNHKVDYTVSGVSAVRGEELALNGTTIDSDGRRTTIQSKYFQCNACHNIEREETDLANPNPDERLVYTVENDLPFLQGSPLFGIVNRRTFYNDDYVKKYGDLVKDARFDLRNAIQLCAVECSQGRALEEWELESVLAYLWTLQFKMNDLAFTSEELKQIESALNEHTNEAEMIELIQSKYVSGYPATFLSPPPNRKEGNGLDGSPENGKMLYKQSCMYCHYDKEYSFLRLDDSKASLKYLAKKSPGYHRHSTYQVVRYGTYPKAGKKAYMPLYPEEKLSEQQLADLIAYYNSGR